MLMAFDDTENLFSYGTLQSEAVQLATLGRRLEGNADRLIGYRVIMLAISDHKPGTNGASHHRKHAGQRVGGRRRIAVARFSR